MTKLRRGHVWCPRAGGGAKGPCGAAQRKPASVAKCDHCGSGARMGKDVLPDVDLSNFTESQVSDARVNDDNTLDFSKLKGKDRTKAMQEEILEGMNNIVQDPEEYRNYLDFISNNYGYSWRNSMLIHMQKPGASNCKTYKQWSALGYQVKKGSKSASVLRPLLVPKDKAKSTNQHRDLGSSQKSRELGTLNDDLVMVGYSSYNVFDVSDLDESVKEPPKSAIQKHIDDYRKSDIPDNEAMRKDLTSVADALGVKVISKTKDNDSSIASGSGGYAKTSTDPDYKYEIVLDGDAKPSETTHTLAHELGHIMCGHLEGENMKAYISKMYDKDRGDMECEAESLAYIISKDYGLESEKFGHAYLKSWSSDKDDVTGEKRIKKAMQGVQKASNLYYSTLEKIVSGKNRDEVNQEAREKVKKAWKAKKK